LLTAYYLTNDARNQVIVLERNRKACEESSGCTGGVLQLNGSTPSTAVSFTNILKSFYLMTGPSVCHSTKLAFQPAIGKYTWHFLRQGYSWQLTKQTADLQKILDKSKIELANLCEDLGISI
jgi:glycine/D-amino acid oxidase-like deaminating enzyme